MIKCLPDLRKIIFILLAFFIIGFQLVSTVPPVNAQTPTPGSANGSWVKDDEVTFVGKSGARSGEFLDWALATYNWSFVGQGQNNPLGSFWATIRNIVY